jgi:hypothetical protein
MEDPDERQWYYVDIVTEHHVRIAVKAEDAEEAKDHATALVDQGIVDPCGTENYSFGGVGDKISSGGVVEGDVPEGMLKFETPQF